MDSKYKNQAITSEQVWEALVEHHGYVRSAAKALGISRGSVYRVIKMTGLMEKLTRLRQERRKMGIVIQRG